MFLLAQNRQADRERDEIERDRDMNARSDAETEYLARKIAAGPLAVDGKVDRDDIIEPIRRLARSIERLRAADDESSS